MPAASVVTHPVTDSDIYTETVRIPSAAGELAGELSYALARPRLGCALFNPHPFMGGQMDNNELMKMGRLYEAVGQTAKALAVWRSLPAAALPGGAGVAGPGDTAVRDDDRAGGRGDRRARRSAGG